MQLSMFTWMRREPLDSTLERLARCGYSSVAIDGDLSRFGVNETRHALRRHGLTCWGMAAAMSAQRDLLHTDGEVRAAAISYLLECLELVAGLEGQVLSLPPAPVFKRGPVASFDQEWDWAVAGLRQVAVAAERFGIRVAVEPLNRFESYFLNRHDQALTLAREVGDNCGVALDLFHMNIEEHDIAQAIRKAGPLLLELHVADNTRCPPGHGSLDWASIERALRAIGYQGALVVEFTHDERYRTDLGRAVGPRLRSNQVDEQRFFELVQQSAGFLRPWLSD